MAVSCSFGIRPCFPINASHRPDYVFSLSQLKWTAPDEEGLVQYMVTEKGFRSVFLEIVVCLWCAYVVTSAWAMAFAAMYKTVLDTELLKLPCMYA